MSVLKKRVKNNLLLIHNFIHLRHYQEVKIRKNEKIDCPRFVLSVFNVLYDAYGLLNVAAAYGRR
jgi:hypothetical protein